MQIPEIGIIGGYRNVHKDRFTPACCQANILHATDWLFPMIYSYGIRSLDIRSDAVHRSEPATVDKDERIIQSRTVFLHGAETQSNR